MKVFLYSLSTCPWCRKTKKFLRENHISFDFVDYDSQSKAEQGKIIKEMGNFGGGKAFPLVVIGEVVIIGYNPERIALVLDIKKAKV
jgi:glutaredoxin